MSHAFSSMDDAEVAAFLPALHAALTFEDEETQLWTVGMLERIGPAAARAVMDALGSQHQPVRAMAAAALSRCGSEGVPGLIRALDDEDRDVRRAALGSLMTLGPQAADAAPGLEKWLDSDDAGIRCLSALALARGGA